MDNRGGDRSCANAQTSSGVLGSVLKENEVFLGGSSMGKGFRRAARYYLRKQAPLKVPTLSTESSSLLNRGVNYRVEDPFFVVDIGVVISQYYQWQKHFPRVEVFYAVKCNPDPVLVKSLASLGCNFDCASKNEIRLVQNIARQLSTAGTECAPEIIYANPTKARSHIIEAVCRNVILMTFDNEEEVKKCASISSNIQLVLRIITDDSGSQCRLSSKYGAPKSHWRSLLSAAKLHGLEVVGVSFHVGSGCRDASRYELALRDARELFDMAESDEFGFKMKLLDIGGGFPGETHSLWNPSTVFGDPTATTDEEERYRKYTIDEELDEVEDENDDIEGKEQDSDKDEDGGDKPLMYFNEIAEAIVPIMDELFPPESGVRIIAEPGRYLTAAASTLCASIVSVRSNARYEGTVPKGVSDGHAAFHVDQITRAEENQIVQDQSNPEHAIIDTIVEELADYSKRVARLNLSQQEVDVYTENADLVTGKMKSAASLLAPPEERLPDGMEQKQYHTVEGMQMGIVAESVDMRLGDEAECQPSSAGALTVAGAGEAAVSGVLMQAMADSAPLQDEFAYYINDGCYGSFNNLLFDHATVRPRRLRNAIAKNHRIVETDKNGCKAVEAVEDCDSSVDGMEDDDNLYPSTVWGPTCDSMDVISRSVLLPKMNVGDWLYFQNMGAYTCAAASAFNGFSPTEKFYVCSVLPEHFEKLADGPKGRKTSWKGEEKKYEDI
eukprot:CAMPEP_0113547708 /NCGR_PEP_ID=MMETSP0015_2-20120614/12502_1 /TAXON_ID=2838 /ORGANISM="Odontella" /LENGTH=724 /DNA_ID=CAMNT_0000448285 /DNA_START=597 /DNA_END=2771 /DNA_ORIENTATION=+ /assembly_acc=CAM_ASM_000160